MEIAERMEAVRKVVGNDFGIAVDFHGRISKGMAKTVIKALEPYNPMFIEEPVLSENWEALKIIQQTTVSPIAMGERMFSRWDFKHPLSHGLVDIVQPDLSHAGGISEVMRIASMAEAYDVSIAPHCPLGPISLASALQVDFCRINAIIQESSLGIHYNQGIELLDYVSNPEVFDIKNGYIDLFKKPGLGIDINEDKVREMSDSKMNWKNPIWRNEDGSITEW